MRYETRALLSTLAAIAALTTGCKQQSREEAEPAHAATPSAAPAPAPTPAPAASADPAPAGSFDIPMPVQPNVPAAAPASPAPSGSAAAKKPAGGGESLKTCCTALRKEATSAPDKAQLYNGAATSCDAIDKLVAAGTTKKSAALTTLRAGLKGQKLPPGCE